MNPVKWLLSNGVKRGFTLIELLIAISIAATILAIIYTSYSTTIRIRKDTDERMNIYQRGRSILDRMSKEIGSAISFEGREGFASTITMEEVITKGMVVPKELQFVGDEDTISFLSTFGFSKGGIFKISYYTESDFDELSLYCREEGMVDLLRSDDPFKEDEGKLLAENISELKFRYYNGKEWIEEWPRGISYGYEVGYKVKPLLWKLPKGVEITLILKDGEETTFSTIVYIPTADKKEVLFGEE